MQGLTLTTRPPAQGQPHSRLAPGTTFGIQGSFGGTPLLSPHYDVYEIPDHELAREQQRLFLKDLVEL